MTMRKQTFRSGMAVTASSLGVQALGFVTTIVLARLLEPTDFGMMRFAGVLLGTMNLFSGMGMGPALIATAEDKNRAAFHAFVITVASGSVLTVVVFLLSPWFASLLGKAEVATMCRWMSVGVLLMTLRIVPYNLLAKDMQFGRRIVPEISSSLLRMAVAVGLAVAGFGVWSLVISWIVERAVFLVATTIVCPSLGWLKRQAWDRRIIKGLWSFGFTHMRTGLIQYAYNNGDDLIVGKFLGASSLGFYTQAYHLSNLPVTHISSVVNAVLLPAYAQIRDDRERLARAFLNSFQFVATLTLPVAMGIFILAPELIVFLIGEKWVGAIPILQVFALMSTMRPLSGTTSPLFLSLQKPEYNLRTALLQGLSMFALIGFMIRWGATGVAGAVVTAFALGFVYNMYLACWRTGVPVSPRALLSQVWPVAVSTTAMVLVVHLLKGPCLILVGGDHNVVSLAILILAGAITYIGLLLLLRRELVFEIIRLVTSAFAAKRRARKTQDAVYVGADEAHSGE